MKKFLSIILTGCMLFGLLAGCNSKPAPTEPGLNNIEAGKFILTANASITLTYNTDGIIVDVKENNQNGELLANHEENYLGKSCLDAAAQFIANAVEYKFITAETRNVILIPDSKAALLTSDFFTNIEVALKSAMQLQEEVAPLAVVTLIGKEKLTEEGYINFDSAKALIRNEMSVEDFDAYYGDSIPFEGCYIATVEIDGVRTSHSVDAITGLITVPTDQQLWGPDTDVIYDIIDEDLYIDDGYNNEEIDTSTEIIEEEEEEENEE